MSPVAATQRMVVATAAPAPALRRIVSTPRVEAGRIEDAHIVAERPPRTVRRKRTRRAVFVQLLLIAIIAGLLVAGGLLALEAFAPRPEAPFDLVHRSFPALGFSVSRPSTWTESARKIGGDPAVAFGDQEAGRGFRVIVEQRTVAAVRTAIGSEIKHPPAGRSPIGLTAVTVDGNPALRYRFTVGGTFNEQWWIERPGGSFRVEFEAPSADEQYTDELAARIVETFTVG